MSLDNPVLTAPTLTTPALTAARLVRVVPESGPSVILSIEGTVSWPGTVVRAGAATYVDGSGALVEVPANTARITPTGILIEPAGTNLITFSEDMAGA
ncbi:MAG: hypothetical protein ABIJ95_00935, partial [Pseudomonadota bacterium]